MMLEFMGWDEASELIKTGITGAISNSEVTYDLARLMPDRPTPLLCSNFSDAIIRHFG